MTKARLAAGLVIVVLTTLAYLPSIDSPFTHYDDPLYVTNNLERLETPGWAGLAKVFDSTRAWEGGFVEHFPLRDAVYWAIFQGWQIETTTPYHVASLVFHILTCLLLWLFFTQVGIPERGAWFGALLFALHPVHIESVVWIAGLKDPMFTFFMVGGLSAYASYRRAPTWWKYTLMLLALCCGFLVKSIMVAMPVVMLAMELLLAPRARWTELALRLFGPFLISGLFFAQIIGVGRANTVIVGPHGGSWTAHVVLMVWAQVKYLKQALLPTSYRLIYCFEPPTGWGDWRLWVGVAVFAAVAALVWRWRKDPLRLLLVTIYVAAMAPVSNLVPFPAIMADRYLYAPSIGVCGLLALAAVKLRDRAFVAIAVASAVALTFGTASRSWVWQDEEALWEEPDLDPACVVDSAFPAAQSHILRFLTAKDRAVGLNALERALVTPGFMDVGEYLFCNSVVNAARDALMLGGEDRARTWAALSTRMCRQHAEAWNAAMLVNLHKRTELAAGAATKAWRLDKTVQSEAMMWLTWLEHGNASAAAQLTRLSQLGDFHVCWKIDHFAFEAPQLAPALGEALHHCRPTLEKGPPPEKKRQPGQPP